MEKSKRIKQNRCRTYAWAKGGPAGSTSTSGIPRRGLGWGLLAFLLIGPLDGQAAGLFLAPRGVEPLARAGALVAGVENVYALTYNPAGLALASDGILLDFAVPLHTTRYTRRVYGEGPASPAVYGYGLNLPSPTVAVVHGVPWVSGLHVALGLAADYPLVQNWPTGRGQASAPQRYAIGDYRGTALSKVSAGVGYQLGSHVTLGAGLQMLVGQFSNQLTLSTCDGMICSHPENPDYDAPVQVKARNLVIPGVQLGIQVLPLAWLRVGAAWESGYSMDHSATFRVRLPSVPPYQNATLDPQEPQGRIRMRLPQQWRVGAEARLKDVGSLEADFVYDPWSVHRSIEVDLQDATVRNLVALKDYALSPMVLDRGFQDTWSVRLGGTLTPSGLENVTLRAGVMYEPSAIPVEMLTPMTVDLDKWMGSVGAGYGWGRLHMEATYAHVFMASRSVQSSQVFQLNATRPPWAGRTPVGNGRYQSGAHLVGMGVRVDL